MKSNGRRQTHKNLVAHKKLKQRKTEKTKTDEKQRKTKHNKADMRGNESKTTNHNNKIWNKKKNEK